MTEKKNKKKLLKKKESTNTDVGGGCRIEEKVKLKEVLEEQRNILEKL